MFAVFFAWVIPAAIFGVKSVFWAWYGRNSRRV